MQGFYINGFYFYVVPSTIGATEQECEGILDGTLDAERRESILTNVRYAAAELGAAERRGTA